MPTRTVETDAELDRIVRCEFTAVEARHILFLIYANEDRGEYIAPRDQYWMRSERIKAKLGGRPRHD